MAEGKPPVLLHGFHSIEHISPLTACKGDLVVKIGRAEGYIIGVLAGSLRLQDSAGGISAGPTYAGTLAALMTALGRVLRQRSAGRQASLATVSIRNRLKNLGAVVNLLVQRGAQRKLRHIVRFFITATTTEHLTSAQEKIPYPSH